MQSRKQSVVEIATNTVLGYVISFATAIVILPMLGYNITVEQNLYVSLVFTVLSFARSYAVRRLFNFINKRKRRHEDNKT